MSIRDVIRVRNNFLGLFRTNDQELYLESCGLKYLYRTSGVTIGFKDSLSWTFWLKCPTDKPPYWDIERPDSNMVTQIAFRDDYPLAMLFKKYAKDFPLKPTDNFLRNNGQVIA